MDQPPPTFKKWTQFDRVCTCGIRKAVFQRKFEETVSQYMREGLSNKQARLRFLKENKIKKTCCIRDLTYFPKNFIYDDTINAYSDITISKGKKLKENSRDGNNQSHVGYEFLPKTNGQFDFDLGQYCNYLTAISMSDFDRLAILKGNGPVTPPVPQFPNYNLTEVKHMPTVTSEIEPLPDKNLTLQFLNA